MFFALNHNVLPAHKGMAKRIEKILQPTYSIIVIYRMLKGDLNHIITTDIYLIDQILKGRYKGGGKLLDAGCGGGRNISWFVLQSNFDIYAIDTDENAINRLSQIYPSLKQDQLHYASIQLLPFPDEFRAFSRSL